MASERGSYDMFFESEYEKQAKLVCSGCKVKSECLKDAMTGVPQDWVAVRGGMTPEERTRAYRRWLHWTKHRERTDDAWRQWSEQESA